MVARKSVVDYIDEAKFDRYNEILANCEERKKNAPKPERAPRGPMTKEQKKKLTEGRIAKLQAKLAELEAAEA